MVDDSNLKEFNAEYVFDIKYKNILSVIQNGVDFNTIKSILNEADCIMVHRTFERSQKIKEECLEITKYGKKIPFVIFSAGDSETTCYKEKSDLIDGIKKNVFYGRLRYFLEDYLTNKQINLNLLAYGKDYQKIEIRNLSKSIFSVIPNGNDRLTIDYLAKIAVDLKKIVTLSSPKIGISYEDLMEKLEDEPVTFDLFRKNIHNIIISFEQYGKNIYTWR
ncbi:MAG: hypothetical protein IK017_11910 [Paludibacteraceae bacterium]|nr:hypothetical protein [Paludibacteraceae bacterium]